MIKIAVVGLYNSGSTAIAGVLQRLGVHMGAPFWRDAHESAALRERLVAWWNEPEIRCCVPRSERVAGLRQWLASTAGDRECVGAKHPLLSVCADEVVEAWGGGTRIVWAYRPLLESIGGLRRRGWFPNPEQVQESLWEPLNEFLAEWPHVVVDHRTLTSDPDRSVERLVAKLQLRPTANELADAIGFVRPSP